MLRLAPPVLVLLLLALAPLGADGAETLPDTKPLTWTGDLSAKMLDGCHAFIDRKIAASIEARQQHWKRDFSSREAYEKSIAENRRRFARQIGAADARLPPVMERFGDDDNPALVAKTDRFSIHQVRWPVLEGIDGEGLLLEPAAKPLADIVVLTDADQTPEQAAGLSPGIAAPQQLARRLAEQGCRVIVPVLVDRSDRFTGNPISGRPNPGYSHREWIYRQAYHMGRHVIGYEVQKVLAAADWLKQTAEPGAKLGVAGYGEGGLIAFHAAAVDPRIDGVLVSGYFRSRQDVADEPLERNIWALLHEFGDAEIASLIAPRDLVVEYSPEPEVDSRQSTTPPEIGGFRLTGSHGRLHTPPLESVTSEFQRIDALLKPGFQKRQLIRGEREQPIGPASPQAVSALAQSLGAAAPRKTAAADSGDVREQGLSDARKSFDPAERQRRQVKQLEDHVQRLVDDSHLLREQFLKIDAARVETLVEGAKPFRKYAWEELFGKFDDPLQDANPRSRKIYDRPHWTGYEVVLDVLPDVFAWGVLLVPKDVRPGERRPLVVCQHGRNGVPKDTIEGDQRAYHDFAAKLADRGFIVFAPHNPYRGEDRYRMLSRKANAVKASLFSFILAQHEQILNWLETLPMVDRKRIAFYGLSYGGETAVRVPPLLERYCLSICSADFNDWTRKVASTHSPYSFMNTIEWEMPYFDMGRTFSYAELVTLLAPRPFMVERGHADGVAPDEWVASEYAKVRRLYDRLGIGDRTAIEFFNGPHTINGQGTFAFLHRQLQWPEPRGE
ncbi:MAG TPA: dienelactone hydrolase family protein [Pirellulales bacterium]|nr:dienelactone hydrolase family protein [Pirellulales bacterium]